MKPNIDIKTPCFIFDENEFTRSVRGFEKALQVYFDDNTVLGYSVKSNPFPYALRIARKLGCAAEVVSHDEYQLARECGFEPSQIIFNGPLKSADSFVEAIVGGATVNIETKRELQWLDLLPAGKNYPVGLRLSINLSEVSPKDAEGADDASRFGFSDNTDEFAKALRIIDAHPNVYLAGLHIHRSTHTRSLRFYRNITTYAASVIKKYNLHLDYIDVGGGFFGIFHKKPTYLEYAEVIHQQLKDNGLEKLRIIVEPGNGILASAFKFVAEVIDVKHIDDNSTVVTIDGSRNDIDPLFRKTDYLKDILRSDESRDIVPRQIIAGCSCMEPDRFFTLRNEPALLPGDRIQFNNVGAYTMALAPQFIRFWPRVYALGDGGMREVRRPTIPADLYISIIEK